MFTTVYAAGHTVAATSFVAKINQAIIYPILTLLMAAAVLVFVWGAFQYLYKADDASARSAGQQHMLWGIIGIVVMVSAFALLAIVTRTFFGDAAVPTI